MTLVVFLRGVNVGGHKTFRPSVLARELSHYDVANVGAAGTFVVRKPGPIAKFRAELLKKLPFEAEAAVCEGSELTRFCEQKPFGKDPKPADVTRFVSVRLKDGAGGPSLPLALPSKEEWLVRLLGCKGRFVYGEYRRHMKTIGYLGQIDKMFGGKVTTRNWNTILGIVKIVEATAKRTTGLP